MEADILFQTGPGICDREVIQKITEMKDLKIVKLHGDYWPKAVNEFNRITNAPPGTAERFLEIEEGDLESAVHHYYRS